MSTLKTTNLVHPSSSSNNIVLDNSGNVEARKVNGCQRIILEQFYTPCDGSVIATSNGNVTVGGASLTAGYGLPDTYADLAESVISYQPPSGATQVIYEFSFYITRQLDTHPTSHWKLYLDSDQVVDARFTIAGDDPQILQTFKWGFNIGGTANTNVGRVASWGSAKTIKFQARDHSASNDTKMYETYSWEGASGEIFCRPCIGITAIG